jgi:hypothetical protein
MSRYFTCTPQQICKIIGVSYDHHTPYGRTALEMLNAGIKTLTPDPVAIKIVLDFADNLGLSVSPFIDPDTRYNVYILSSNAVVVERKPSVDDMRNAVAARNNCDVSLFESWPEDVVERVYNNLCVQRNNQKRDVVNGYLIDTGEQVFFKATTDSLETVLGNIVHAE